MELARIRPSKEICDKLFKISKIIFVGTLISIFIGALLGIFFGWGGGDARFLYSGTVMLFIGATFLKCSENAGGLGVILLLCGFATIVSSTTNLKGEKEDQSFYNRDGEWLSRQQKYFLSFKSPFTDVNNVDTSKYVITGRFNSNTTEGKPLTVYYRTKLGYNSDKGVEIIEADYPYGSNISSTNTTTALEEIFRQVSIQFTYETIRSQRLEVERQFLEQAKAHMSERFVEIESFGISSIEDREIP
jgi:hypothetical protein